MLCRRMNQLGKVKVEYGMKKICLITSPKYYKEYTMSKKKKAWNIGSDRTVTSN